MKTKIWSAWLQGRKNAPKSVQSIFELWETLNQDCELTVLEEKDVQLILSEIGIEKQIFTPQVKTDITRSYLLAKYGGVWADSTLLPTKPLNSWLNTELKSQGFFAFRSTGSPELVLQNWFLYSESNNVLIKEWYYFYCDYFKIKRFPPGSRRIFLSPFAVDYFAYRSALHRRDYAFFADPNRGRSCRMYPYAIHNYNFAYLLSVNKNLSEIWQKVPHLYNTRPGLIGFFARDQETPESTFLDLAMDLLPCSPVHKLNHRDQRFARMIDLAISKNVIST